MSTQDSIEPSSSSPPLPSDFRTIDEILKMDPRTQSLVNVIGFLKDYQPPVSTRGTDFKCAIEIKDHSVQYQSYGIKVSIFWPLAKMPRIYGVSDAILIRKAKLQLWQGEVSLLANFNSEFHVLPASQIPKMPLSISHVTKRMPKAIGTTAHSLPWQPFSPGQCHIPTVNETNYVILANTQIAELALPSSGDFQEKSMQAMAVKEKFSLLKDVKPETFVDILGQVVKVLDNSSDRVTMYLSDYTANSLFYNQVWGEGHTVVEDEYGYSKPKSKANDWPGPYGKLSIQLTLYDGHANFVRENSEKIVKEWVMLRNVQINFGKMGGCLEGFLRGDQRRFEGKIQIEIVKTKDDLAVDPRYKEAVCRKLQWWDKFKKQKQDLLDEASGAGTKRKRDCEESELPKNSKQKRKEKRAAAFAKAAADDAKQAQRLHLNGNIRCTHPDLSTTPLHTILERPKVFLCKDDTQKTILPFNVANYRAHVRVVGYFPDRLQDFSVGRRESEFDILSDYSGGEDTDPEEDRRLWKEGKGFGKKNWEWRFALQVEDADPRAPKERMWLNIDNHSGQGLLDMDATNLRGDPIALHNLKEKLCILWGDLEEQKSALLRKEQPEEPTSSMPPSTANTELPSSPLRQVGAQPALDSDDEDEPPWKRASVLTERDPNIRSQSQSNEDKGEKKVIVIEGVKNKAFTCCIKQYGIKVKEEDPEKATAGNGKRWERSFGLFGTNIL